jgi:hypothetical protein
MKIKVGTQLDDRVFQQLKVASARVRRPMGELLQEAVVSYLHQARRGHGRKSGLSRLLEREPLRLSDEQFRASLDEDLYAR